MSAALVIVLGWIVVACAVSLLVAGAIHLRERNRQRRG